MVFIARLFERVQFPDDEVVRMLLVDQPKHEMLSLVVLVDLLCGDGLEQRQGKVNAQQ